MGKAEAQAASEIYEVARQKADQEMQQLRSEIDAIREESQAAGMLRVIDYQQAQNEMLKYMVLMRLRDSKEYRKGGLTWDEFCTEAVGECKRGVDAKIADIRPLVEHFGNLFSQIAGVSFSKIRYLGKSIGNENSQIEDGALVIDGQKIPLSPENKDDIEALIDALKESQKRELEEKDATLRANERVIEAKEDVIRRQEREIQKFEVDAEKKGLTLSEDAFIQKMEGLRPSFDGYMLKVDPERVKELQDQDEPPTPRMIAAYLTTLDYMRKQLLAAYDTALDMYGSVTIAPEEGWVQPDIDEDLLEEG